MSHSGTGAQEHNTVQHSTAAQHTMQAGHTHHTLPRRHSCVKCTISRCASISSMYPSVAIAACWCALVPRECTAAPSDWSARARKTIRTPRHARRARALHNAHIWAQDGGMCRAYVGEYLELGHEIGSLAVLQNELEAAPAEGRAHLRSHVSCQARTRKTGTSDWHQKTARAKETVAVA